MQHRGIALMPLQYIFVSMSYQKQDIDYTVKKFYYVAKWFAQACCIEVQIVSALVIKDHYRSTVCIS